MSARVCPQGLPLAVGRSLFEAMREKIGCREDATNPHKPGPVRTCRGAKLFDRSNRDPRRYGGY